MSAVSFQCPTCGVVGHCEHVPELDPDDDPPSR